MMETIYQVKLKRIAPVKIMSIRKATTEAKLYEDSEKSYRSLLEYISKNEGTLTNEVFSIYHNPEYNPNFIDIEYCFVVEALLPPTAIIKARETTEQIMASVIHRGSATNLGFIYATILDWAKDNDYKVSEGGMRERYPLNQSFVADDLQIEILVPVEKIPTVEKS